MNRLFPTYGSYCQPYILDIKVSSRVHFIRSRDYQQPLLLSIIIYMGTEFLASSVPFRLASKIAYLR